MICDCDGATCSEEDKSSREGEVVQAGKRMLLGDAANPKPQNLNFRLQQPRTATCMTDDMRMVNDSISKKCNVHSSIATISFPSRDLSVHSSVFRTVDIHTRLLDGPTRLYEQLPPDQHTKQDSRTTPNRPINLLDPKRTITTTSPWAQTPPRTAPPPRTPD